MSCDEADGPARIERAAYLTDWCLVVVATADRAPLAVDRGEVEREEQAKGVARLEEPGPALGREDLVDVLDLALIVHGLGVS